MKCLVTGGAGFIGSNLIKILNKNNSLYSGKIKKGKKATRSINE